MDKEYNLSFIVCTKNRLPYLKILVEHFLNKIGEDEEIVIVDGGSTDGSKEYLESLLNEGLIHQFISESDRNQAHGWNKALLMAKGKLIKKIIDDDVFCYESISKCKQYLLGNPLVDVLISNDLTSSFYDHEKIQKQNHLSEFEKWAKGLIPSFVFSDVHMLLRKNSIPFLGLYNTEFVNMDWEYSLRISYLKANIALYTGYNALSVYHDDTVTSMRNEQLIRAQGERGKVFYEYKDDLPLWSKVKISLGKLLSSSDQKAARADNGELASVYNYYYEYISELNKANEFTFYSSEK